MQWWYNETEGIFHEAFPEVKLRKCTQSDKDGFFEVNEVSKDYVNSRWDLMMCLDNPDDVILKGQSSWENGHKKYQIKAFSSEHF